MIHITKQHFISCCKFDTESVNANRFKYTKLCEYVDMWNGKWWTVKKWIKHTKGFKLNKINWNAFVSYNLDNLSTKKKIKSLRNKSTRNMVRQCDNDKIVFFLEVV